MDQTYMKEKPVVPLLLSMGIPVIISMIAGALTISWTAFSWHRSVRTR
ncbi:MAG: hypothetical protein ACLT76_18625 [Clostridium fessum]